MILGAFMVIGLIASLFSNSTGKNSAAVTPGSNPQIAANNSTYVKVVEFNGNGTKKSQVFELHGRHARIRYVYKSGASDIGAFNVYVTPDGEDVKKTGGFPELMIDKAKDKGESAIQKDPGKYYLDVNAMGDWSIIVEEEQ